MTATAPPRVLGFASGWDASQEIIVARPLGQLAREGAIELRLAGPGNFEPSLLNATDLVVFCRSFGQEDCALVEQLAGRGIPYVYTIDDDLFSVPIDVPGAPIVRDPANLARLRFIIRHAAVVRVYSEAMLERCLPLNPRSELCGTYYDVEMIEGVTPRQPDAVEIVYATPRIVDPLQDVMSAALVSVASRYGRQVRIVFWGPRPIDPELAGLENFSYVEPTRDYREFSRSLYERGFAIGLAPMFDGVFYRAKSNNKYREYGACGIAGIYSATPPYTGSVVHGQNGLLVENTTDAWRHALERLIEDEALRRTIAENARADVRAHYTLEAFAAGWHRSIDLARGSAPTRDVACPVWGGEVCFLLGPEYRHLRHDHATFFHRLDTAWRGLGCAILHAEEHHLHALILAGHRNFLVATDDAERLHFLLCSATRRPDLRFVVCTDSAAPLDRQRWPANVLRLEPGAVNAAEQGRIVVRMDAPYYADHAVNPYVFLSERLICERFFSAPALPPVARRARRILVGGLRRAAAFMTDPKGRGARALRRAR